MSTTTLIDIVLLLLSNCSWEQVCLRVNTRESVSGEKLNPNRPTAQTFCLCHAHLARASRAGRAPQRGCPAGDPARPCHSSKLFHCPYPLEPCYRPKPDLSSCANA